MNGCRNNIESIFIQRFQHCFNVDEAIFIWIINWAYIGIDGAGQIIAKDDIYIAACRITCNAFALFDRVVKLRANKEVGGNREF